MCAPLATGCVDEDPWKEAGGHRAVGAASEGRRRACEGEVVHREGNGEGTSCLEVEEPT